MSTEIEPQRGPTTGTWIGLIIGILYAVLPIDILPDLVPVAGWIDDIVITGALVLNFFQAKASSTSQEIASILKFFKWILIILGVIAILVIALIGGLLFKYGL